MNNGNPVSKEQGWRSAAADWIARAQTLISFLDTAEPIPLLHKGPAIVLQRPGEEASFKASDVIRRLLHLLDSMGGSVKAEERQAWDRYAAAHHISSPLSLTKDVVRWANDMLDERRATFESRRFTRERVEKLEAVAHAARMSILHEALAALDAYEEKHCP